MKIIKCGGKAYTAKQWIDALYTEEVLNSEEYTIEETNDTNTKDKINETNEQHRSI